MIAIGNMLLYDSMIAISMNTTRFMGITTTILSVAMMVLFVQPSDDFSRDVFAEKKDAIKDIKMTTEIKRQDNVGLEFGVPETITAGKLVQVNARVHDSNQNANLSHTDWSYSIIDPNGNVLHKSTTLHGHYGVMNFKESFPQSGTYKIKYTISSSGPVMLGKPVPELGQTRSVISGDLLKFDQDPKNNFGSRSFEFEVNVKEQEKTVILYGSENNTPISVKFSTQPEKIIAGQPSRILIDVDDAETGEDATHVDGQISIRRGNYYPSQSGNQPDTPVPIPLHGAYHGHLGAISLTQTFPQPGTYIVNVDLSGVPYSEPLFGQTSARFVIQVFSPEEIQTDEKKQPVNEVNKTKVDIVGLENPFYTPNTVRASVGQVITFDNIDGNHHTVTSIKSGTTEHDEMFDSGLLSPGEKYELVINEKGTYDYYCALHTGMQGTVIIS